MKAKSRLLIENRLVNHLTKNKPAKKEMKHIDNLTYKTFINKFNKTYEKTLRKEQKNLLTNYIVSFSDNGLGLKSFLNEEISRLKKEVNSLCENEKTAENADVVAIVEYNSKAVRKFRVIVGSAAMGAAGP